MPAIKVSMPTYDEIVQALEKQGKSTNSGEAVTITGDTAIIPPHNFKLVNIRMGCLEAAANSYVPPHKAINKENLNYNDTGHFTKHCEGIFQWVMNGEQETENKAKPEPKTTPDWGKPKG